jgi:hypothetical protein
VCSRALKLRERTKELCKKHNCTQWVTIAGNIATQFPPFMLLSVVLHHASQAPTPLDSESFLTLTTLTHPDTTFFVPILVGIATLANIEVNGWTRLRRLKSMSSLQSERPTLSSMSKSTYRLLSLFRVSLTATVPGVGSSLQNIDKILSKMCRVWHFIGCLHPSGACCTTCFWNGKSRADCAQNTRRLCRRPPLLNP